MSGISGHIDYVTGVAEITGAKILRVDSLTIVFDGSLFNKKELCQELGFCGIQFIEVSDEEILLAAFIQWGEKCVKRLNGVFAFAVWNERSKTLFAARDHMGVKPFFFKALSGGIVFASELGVLFRHPLCPALIDRDGINQMFLLGPGRVSGSGVFKGVEELQAGEYLNLGKRGLRKRTYFKLKAKPHKESLEQTIKHLRTLLLDSIDRQLVGDVMPACFLSGGLDSSIITYAASQKSQKSGEVISTFSIDFKDNEKHFVKNFFQTGGDAEYIKTMVDSARTKHKSLTLESGAVFDALKEAALARGLCGMGDVDSALLLGCKEVVKSHGVVLSGECADELFGGYPWYFDENALDKPSFPWARSIDIRKELLSKEYLAADPEKYVGEFVKQTIDDADVLKNEPEQDRRARRLFMLNCKWFMQTLLDRSDRMARVCGLEIRVPFCDWRVAEYAYNIPWAMKALNGREKGLLREAFKGILPDEIIERKKNPFPKTYDPQYYQMVRKGAIDAVNRGGLLSSLINKEYFNTLINTPPEQINPWYGQLMRLPQVFAMLIQMDYIFEEFNVRLV